MSRYPKQYKMTNQIQFILKSWEFTNTLYGFLKKVSSIFRNLFKRHTKARFYENSIMIFKSKRRIRIKILFLIVQIPGQFVSFKICVSDSFEEQ